MKYTHRFKRKDRAGDLVAFKSRAFRPHRGFGTDITVIVRSKDGHVQEEVIRSGQIVSLRTPVEHPDEQPRQEV